MKKEFEITDKSIITKMLQDSEYGTLALSHQDKPYSLPINFVYFQDAIYFHGSKSGRKIDIIKQNSLASFSVVEAYSIIPSYFSSNENLACPATQAFKSIIIDGKIEFVKEYDEKADALSALMQKLQPEGKYKSLHDKCYQKMINATTIYKLILHDIKAKFKFGQHLNQERFDMIISNLEKRGSDIDLATIKMMKEQRAN